MTYTVRTEGIGSSQTHHAPRRGRSSLVCPSDCLVVPADVGNGRRRVGTDGHDDGWARLGDP